MAKSTVTFSLRQKMIEKQLKPGTLSDPFGGLGAAVLVFTGMKK